MKKYIINPRSKFPIASIPNVKAALINNNCEIFHDGERCALLQNGVEIVGGSLYVKDKIRAICILESFDIAGLNDSIKVILKAAELGIKS